MKWEHPWIMGHVRRSLGFSNMWIGSYLADLVQQLGWHSPGIDSVIQLPLATARTVARRKPRVHLYGMVKTKMLCSSGEESAAKGPIGSYHFLVSKLLYTMWITIQGESGKNCPRGEYKFKISSPICADLLLGWSELSVKMAAIVPFSFLHNAIFGTKSKKYQHHLAGNAPQCRSQHAAENIKTPWKCN